MTTERQREAARKGAEVTNAKRRAQAAAEGRKPREKGEPKLCLCGCEEMTKGGTFVMGHDARYKSQLIKKALTDDQDAIQALESRGWTKFLDKARETASRPKSERVRKVKTEAEIEQSAAERAQVLVDLKAAKAKLVENGIVRNNSITRYNYKTILDGDYPFETLGWAVGQRCQVEYQGVRYDGNITEIAGSRAKVEYDTGEGVAVRVFELVSLLEPRTDAERKNNVTVVWSK